MDRAKGEVYAFIDSDAYPAYDWLDTAIKYLAFDKCLGVCGPGILPSDAHPLEQAADLVYKLLPYNYRVVPKGHRIVKDYPTFNLIVKKTDIRFKKFLTGEDTLFCQELSKQGKILYSPEVIVYHNRRPLFKAFTRQVSTYGLHRGHLIKLALLGLIAVLIYYPINFIKGFIKRED
jgi:GT2 family glycosyltransferase